MNSFYNHGSFPSPLAPASSALLRAEFDSVMAGFDKLPILAGNGGLLVRVNAAGTSLEASSAIAGLSLTGGTIDNAVIGATIPAALFATTISASTGFLGNLGGNVAGDVTSAGTSSFNNVSISGTLDLNAGTAGTITGLSTPTLNSDAATKQYVDSSISALVNGAPGVLDTLSEISAALGNDPNLSATLTASIATKLALAGGTMNGPIDMGSNKITGLTTPTVSTDAVNLSYVTTLFGSTDAAAVSAAAASSSASAAATSASNASTSATNASNSAAAAATSATNAATSATASAGSASAASTSATNASNSATAASGSATTATTKASAAATSATNAATSATNAANSATAAATSATDAAASAVTAANSVAGLLGQDTYLGDMIGQAIKELYRYEGVTDPRLAALEPGMDVIVQTMVDFADLLGVTARAVSGGDIMVRLGTVGNPSISIFGNRNTGFYSPAANQLAVTTNGVQRLLIDATGNHLTGTDNAQTLGSAAKRWSTVYAGTGTINTSDAREKTVVAALTADEIAAAKDLSKEVGTYQFLDSIAAKGNAARHHVGMTVQRAIQIMQAHNLDPMRYGFVCYDAWPEVSIEHPAVAAVPEVLDADGNVVAMETPAQDAWTEVIQTAGDRYSFRYDQLNLFIAAGLNARLAALEI